MKKIIFFNFMVFIFAIFAFPFLLALLLKFFPYNIQPELSGTVDIYSQNVVYQEFISQEDSLVAIGLSIRNLNLKNKKDLNLEIFDNSNFLVRNVTINGASIRDGDLIKFVFEPISDSKNKTFVIKMSSKESTRDDVLKPFYTKSDINWMRNLIVEDAFKKEEIEGRLAMVTYHKPKSKIVLAWTIMQKTTERFWQDKGFAFFYLGISVFLIFAILLPRSPRRR